MNSFDLRYVGTSETCIVNMIQQNEEKVEYNLHRCRRHTYLTRLDS